MMFKIVRVCVCVHWCNNR